ncbi:hypothetical protein K501DRAFT_288595 [Backusella circina FSU 941]|nr:hypothetical protein K501DRAFT_288595 [Backusella circina FSU 941]
MEVGILKTYWMTISYLWILHSQLGIFFMTKPLKFYDSIVNQEILAPKQRKHLPGNSLPI